MKRLFFVLTTLIAVALSMSSCRQTGNTIPAHNPFVEAFTGGTISRFTAPRVVFSGEIATDKMTEASLRNVTISPSVKGRFEFENSSTIVFRPEGGALRQDTKYQIKVDMKDWFDVDKDNRIFEFSFATQPFALQNASIDFQIAQDDDTKCNFTFLLRSSDKEAAEEVEKAVKFSENVTAVWEHSEDGLSHTVTLNGIARGNEERELTLSIKGSDKKIYAIIPAADRFEIRDIVYSSTPTRVIDIVFTQNLNPKSVVEGAAYIEDNKSKAIQIVDGNKVRLYPDNNKRGSVNVVITPTLRNSKGEKLNEQNIVRTISAGDNKPSVQFIGDGIIVPTAEQVTVPFRTSYLRGVRVRVIRVFQNNVGQFLQDNNYDGTYNLVRMGRLVALKTIFFEDENGVTPQDGVFAVDLKQLIDIEPGAIYRINLSFDRDLSTYPCNDNYTPKTKQQIEKEDTELLRKELSQFDSGDDYYSYYYQWDDWGWKSTTNPCSEDFYSYYNSLNKTSKNVFATNLALTVKMPSDGREATALVRDLLTASPVEGVDVTFYNYQQQPIGKGQTGSDGTVRISLTGRTYFAIAKKGAQYSYLKIGGASALSMSSFDVSGESIQGDMKGFIYGERGVWRPGDTIHLGFMLQQGVDAPTGIPATATLFTPSGKQYAHLTKTTSELGLYTFDFETSSEAPTGSWRVRIEVGGASFSKNIMVETIKPNRLKIDMSIAEGSTILSGEEFNIPMHVEWLSGATARELAYDVTATFSAVTTTFKGFEGYTFDDVSRRFSNSEMQVDKGKTDEKGDANVSVKATMKNVAGMLRADLATKVYESGGDFSIDVRSVKFSPYRQYVGLRSPQEPNGEALATGKAHSFDVASVDYTGKAIPADLRVEVYRLSYYWWWSSYYYELGDYTSSSYHDPVRSFSVKTNIQGKGKFSLNFTDGDWGTYYIRVSDTQGNHSSGTMAYFDWSYNRRQTEAGETATTLNLATDKNKYQPGKTIALTVPSVEGGRAIVSVEKGSQILSINEYECKRGETIIEIKATEAMQPNAYLSVQLIQPHGATTNDVPIRLYGVVPVAVSSPESHLTPTITMPDEVRPNEKYTISVTEKSGREMAYTIAVVDEGLLDLTRFKTPDPWSAFNKREALGINSWDVYNFVLGAYGGRIEKMFSIGGDDEAEGKMNAQTTLNRFTPVVEFLGPFHLKRGAKGKHTLTMPNYNGRVRVMAVATDGKRSFGNGEKSVMVRQPLMLLATLPRIIGTAETMSVPATIFTTKKGSGNVKVTIECSANLKVVGTSTQSIQMNDIGDRNVMFTLTSNDNSGKGHVKITATAGSEKSIYETDIEIRSTALPQTKVTGFAVEAGKTWSGNVEMFGMEGTNSLIVELADVQPVNLGQRLSYLIGYPHGCVEQTTSKGFPQLYLSKLTTLSKEFTEQTETNIRATIKRLGSYQTSNGGFSYWAGGNSANDWGSVYATHFLIEADAAGYDVPVGLKSRALSYLKNAVNEWQAPSRNVYYSSYQTQGYRLYVLALAKKTELGAMNRLRSIEKLDDRARLWLAAAYSTAGRADVARELITTSVPYSPYDQYDYTYGSALRDDAVRLLALTALNDSQGAVAVAKRISDKLSGDNWLSTQESAFSLMAMAKYISRYETSEELSARVNINGKSESIKSDKHIYSLTPQISGTRPASIQIQNRGNATLFVRLIATGTPPAGDEQPYANGVNVMVKYFDDNGNEIDVKSMPAGVNFKAQATVRNTSPVALRNLILTQIVPAGWEIINTRFLAGVAAENSGSEGGTTYTPENGISYQDFRDDRVYSYIDYLSSGRAVTLELRFTTAYEGEFSLPSVRVEAMYDNLVKANTASERVGIKN